MFLSADIEDLPPPVQEKLFDEVLDRDVQKGKHGRVTAGCGAGAGGRTLQTQGRWSSGDHPTAVGRPLIVFPSYTIQDA